MNQLYFEISNWPLNFLSRTKRWLNLGRKYSFAECDFNFFCVRTTIMG